MSKILTHWWDNNGRFDLVNQTSQRHTYESDDLEPIRTSIKAIAKANLAPGFSILGTERLGVTRLVEVFVYPHGTVDVVSTHRMPLGSEHVY